MVLLSSVLKGAELGPRLWKKMIQVLTRAQTSLSWESTRSWAGDEDLETGSCIGDGGRMGAKSGWRRSR